MDVYVECCCWFIGHHSRACNKKRCLYDAKQKKCIRLYGQQFVQVGCKAQSSLPSSIGSFIGASLGEPYLGPYSGCAVTISLIYHRTVILHMIIFFNKVSFPFPHAHVSGRGRQYQPVLRHLLPRVSCILAWLVSSMQ